MSRHRRHSKAPTDPVMTALYISAGIFTLSLLLRLAGVG